MCEIKLPSPKTIPTENLATLPTDILTLIADQLPIHEIYIFASVCRSFHVAAQWTISKYKRLSAVFAKVANNDSHDDHHAEYLPDLLAKVVDEPGIGNCIRNLCVEETVPGGYIMRAGHPHVDRFRWELYRRAIQPFHLQDSRTRDEMDWIWQFCDDSVVIALLFYLAPRIRHLQWQVREFSHRLLMRFLASRIEGRPSSGADFLSRLTSVRLVASPAEDARQPHGFHTLAIVSLFLALPSMKTISCERVTQIQLPGEAEPRYPLPGTSNVQSLRFVEPTISVEEGDWLYSTVAAMKSLETFRFTPNLSDYGDFASILTVLAKTQCESLKEIKLWGDHWYETSNIGLIGDKNYVKSLKVFPNLKCIDTELMFLRDLMEASGIGGQSLAMIIPSSVEYLKLRLGRFHQLMAEIHGLEEIAKTKSSTMPRLNTLHLRFDWDVCSDPHFDMFGAVVNLTRVLYDQCKAENVKLDLVAEDGEMDSEWYEL